MALQDLVGGVVVVIWILWIIAGCKRARGGSSSPTGVERRGTHTDRGKKP